MESNDSPEIPVSKFMSQTAISPQAASMIKDWNNACKQAVFLWDAIAVLDAYQNNKIPSPNKALRKITQKRQNSSAVDSSALWDGSRERDKLMS